MKQTKELIMIVEDDRQIQDFIAYSLMTAGFGVLTAGGVEEAMRKMRSKKPDIMVLDLGLPDGDGLDLIRRVRKFSDIPIIVVSARDKEEDKIEALDRGAEDYITKPFSMRELLARVKANIRRSGMAAVGTSAQPSVGGRLELGRISIDAELLMAYKDNAPLDLTQREYELLKFLASNPGKVFSREALMENVWNYEGYVGDVRAVDVAVRRLREKVEDDPASPQFVVTRRGLGYLFNA